jgi:putative ABC transport system permease protein
MSLVEALKLSLASLYAHKLRSALTLIGIVIGVMTVIAVVSLIQGVNRYVSEDVIRLGANVFMISKSPNVIISTDEWRKIQLRKDLTLADMDAIRAASPHSEEVGAAAYHMGLVKHSNQFMPDVMIRGWTETVQRILDLDLISGRYLTPAEAAYGNRVCLVGHDIAENLYAGVDPIGRMLYVDSLPYTIIGVGRKQGATLGRTRDTWVKIPMGTYIKHYGARRSVRIFVKVASLELMERAQDEVRLVLRARRHVAYAEEDDFTVETQQTFIAMWSNISSMFFAATIALASLSLLIGGIVIMNIMLVSVSERTKEIGLRKSLGARRKDILRQFLIESGTIGLVGGQIGVLMGAVLARSVASFTGLPVSINVWSVVVGLAVSASVGLFFGIYPAHRAAKLDPIFALRQE